MVIKWANAYILIMINAVLTETTSHWTHYEQTYTGGCKSGGNSKSSCLNLGEHAYKGQLLNEPPKGIKFYLDDLEQFYEDYQLDRNKRSSKKKESKNKDKGSSDTLEDEVEGKYYDIDDEEDKIEEPIRKKTKGRKKAQKKKGEENEYEDEKNEEDDTNYEENEDVETDLENKKQLPK
uniref:Uncharacterized protein n=1 Tax=Rhodnius prolixus TaxID=13249 RepID=A0A4P6DBX1_RHOPR